MSKLYVLLTKRTSNKTFFLPCGHNDILVEHLSTFCGRRTKTCQTSRQNRAKFCENFLLPQKQTSECWHQMCRISCLKIYCINLHSQIGPIHTQSPNMPPAPLQAYSERRSLLRNYRHLHPFILVPVPLFPCPHACPCTSWHGRIRDRRMGVKNAPYACCP